METAAVLRNYHDEVSKFALNDLNDDIPAVMNIENKSCTNNTCDVTCGNGAVYCKHSHVATAAV